MADTLFDATATTVIDPEKDYFSELVGEGRKYKEPRDAGRALVEKDRHIASIEAENALFRDEITKRKTMQELIDQVNASRTTEPPKTATEPDDGATPPTHPNQPKVEDLVRDAIDAKSARDSANANRNRVVEVLRANFGPGYTAVLTAKVEQLGLGTKFVDDLAGKSPQAVYQLLGITETPKNPPASAGAARTNPGAVRTGQKNFAFYETMRKADPRSYFSQKISKEMIEAATEQGDDFYR